MPHTDPPHGGGAAPRDAATVLLLRDASDRGIEVWMQRRLLTLTFAPGAWVFPGGVVEPADAQPLPGGGGTLTGLSHALGCSIERTRAVLAAAIRETFEECGVLLAKKVADQAWAVGRESDRTAILAESLSLPELLQRDGLRVDVDALGPWDRWLTPAWSPRRYDTWFFIVDATDVPSPRHVDEGEATEADWHRPDALVQQWAAIPGALLPPTLATLESLAVHDNVKSVLAARPHVLERHDG